MVFQLRLAEYDPSNESPRVDVTYKISSALKYRVDMMTQLHGWTLVNTGCSAECGTGGKECQIEPCPY